MSQAAEGQDVDEFLSFYRTYYSDDIARLAQNYPKEQRSLYVDYNDLYTYDPDIAERYLNRPGEMQEVAEEALRTYDLPVDISLGQAHVRLRDLPRESTLDIRGIRVSDDHIGSMVAVQGIVRKATDVRPKIVEAAFECQRCGTMTYIPQNDSGFQEPHECQGCERQGPFRVNNNESKFIDSQQLRVQESPEGLRGGETPQSIDVNLEDDVCGRVTPGDHVTVVGRLEMEQVTSGQEKTTVFDPYMEGVSVVIEDEEFEDMDITDEDKQEILELSTHENIYEEMVASVAPSIYGYDQEKLSMILQLFSGVTKHLPDGSRIRGDLHMLLIGDPGTGKCVAGDTRVTLADGRDVPIRELVDSTLDDPKPIDDGVWDEADFAVPSLGPDGELEPRQATKVWKREAPEQMLRIRTNSGRELEVTPSHPLFVRENGSTTAIRADELSEGGFVAAPRSLPTRGDDTLDVAFRRSKSNNAIRLDVPDEWTPWLARLVGYVVAEGYVEQRDDSTGYVSVTNNDREVLDDVVDALDRLGVNHFERSPHDGKTAREVVCGSGELVSFLTSLSASMIEGSANQRVPEPIMAASDTTGRAFLRAFVEGEGHVSANEREITVASMSQDLLDDVRTLLLSSGIQSQLHPRHNGSYRLRISGDDFARYVERVGFVTERKSHACAEFADVLGNTNTDVIPAGEELRDLRESLGLTQAECGLPRPTYQHYDRGDRNPSRDSLSAVVSAFEETLAEREPVDTGAVADGGLSVADRVAELRSLVDGNVGWERIESIEHVEPAEEWVYDLEVEGTHSYVSDGLISHNSQMLSYIQNIAPRSVYTSGKGSSSAGLTAAAVRDDFGDGQQWTLEAGALVLADKGIAAVDELDKMRSEDRSAMHEALEQQKISVSKAGINATLKSRCSLLGAANPKYGRFDQYEPIGEQIDLEPALISRFDLIFTVTDSPDPEHDAKLADHILTTNYAGELNTQRERMATSNFTQEEVENVTQEVAPVIDAELLRKYIAYAKRNCFPTMTDEARAAIREFYVDLRSKGADEDAPVPVTARKLEALVRLSEASARVRLSDTVEEEDATRVIDIVRSCLQDIGVDPETGEFDADVVETGRSKTQRDRIKGIKELIQTIAQEYEDEPGAPVDTILERADEANMDPAKAEKELEKLRTRGEIYEPQSGYVRTT
ncbi:LAGLIDADG family homing endonuclease [Halobaculum marinum]|uniref:DNA helicase n=1 Tax=Halobaculum marinum TaxID=3031996 RepID=A0ABD5WW12_9EURY|nr:LAGLIDADG family homing endonuclease [Halobaculum sp. DT55]